MPDYGPLDTDKVFPMLLSYESQVTRRRDYPEHIAAANVRLRKRSTDLVEAIYKERAAVINEWSDLYRPSHLPIRWDDDTVTTLFNATRQATALAEHWRDLDDWMLISHYFVSPNLEWYGSTKKTQFVYNFSKFTDEASHMRKQILEWFETLDSVYYTVFSGDTIIAIKKRRWFHR